MDFEITMQQTTLRTTQRVTATTTTRVTRRQKRPKVAPKRPNKPLEFEMPEVTTTVASLSEGELTRTKTFL